MFGKLKRPCAKCPFRRNVPGYLARGRAEEIAEAITDGDGAFWCHETVDYDGYDEDGEEQEYVASGGEHHCVGAAIMLDRMDQPNQLMRIAERLGLLKYEDLKGGEDVVADTFEFVERHGA